MGAPMQRIVYASRNLMKGTDGEIMSGVQQILRTARVNNLKAGVTGALIFNSGGFAQVLEGVSGSLADVFERIQCDPRHTDVLVLDHGRIEERMFPDWSMGFVGASREGERMFGAISQDSGFDSRRLGTDEILDAMRRLVLEEENV
ncbi:MAG: BLUF domain-containing protein [Beijerinckiaceae bacterium]|jgi:blue light- and temperature-responsive anti-repressor|nr:BLUF domain-containing protein [Beijerinckiaceae bacterium]